MATQEETILLHFDIDEQPAVNSIKDLRTANSQLRAERDKVNISTKEGAELVQKLNVAIDKNNKVIKDNSSALEKQRQNVGNYSKSIQEAAGNLNIMGVNVGGLGAKLASFANPATAAVGIVTALGAAYARSSIGAKDLEFASNQLGFAVTILTDRFAGLFSSVEDGEGIVSRIIDSFITAVAGQDVSIMAKLAANAREELEQISRDKIRAEADIRDIQSENLEILTEIAKKETSIADKKALALKIDDNLTDIAKTRLELLSREEAQERILGGATQNKEGLERKLNELDAERSRVTKEETKQKEKIEKQVNSILTEERKVTEEIRRQHELTVKKIKAQDEADARELAGRQVSFSDDPTSKEFDPQEQFEKDKANIDAELGLTLTAEQQKQAALLQTAALKDQLAEEDFQRNIEIAASSRDLSAALAAIADEGTIAQKALALTTIAINSAIGVSEAVKAGAGKAWPLNLTAILSGITAVLAGIAQAKSFLGFAEGGWTGPGSKYKAVGVVHADEYVTPKRVVNSPAAQPHIAALERMRTGYADGGFVANSNMEASRQSQMLASAFKNMPPIIASWTEGRAVGRKVEFKERVTRQ